MSQGFVDSASFHHVILAFRHPKPREWTPWVWEVLEGITCALWSHPQFQIAPDPSIFKGAGGPFEQMLKDFSLSFSGVAHRDNLALTKTNRWAKSNICNIRNIYFEIISSINFQNWLEEYISFFFVRHVQMHGALFNHEFIPILSSILNCSTKELEKVHMLTQNINEVNRWVKKRQKNEGFDLGINAFSLAALLRGRYHDYAARHSNYHILHHPMRIMMLPQRKTTSEFQLSNTEQYLSKIIFSSALVEPKLEEKIGLWAENIQKIRSAYSLGRLNLQQKDLDSVALELAIDAAKQSDIRVHPRYLELIIDASLSLGISAFTSFTLAPWYIGLSFTVSEFVLSSLKVGEKTAQRLSLTEKRLSDFAQSTPGRIQRSFLSKPK